jgi:solute carrier family 25 S-adenosylmethionine transporter 26
MSSLVSVPTEVVKQRMQAGHFSSLREAAHSIMTKEGPKGFYTGYRTMLLREIPFALIQFPLWEGMKQEVGDWQGQPASPWQGAVCGSLAGSLSAAVTNPLDMVKTRQMLGQSSGSFATTMSQVYSEGGATALFRGVSPRTFWMGLGGFIFFGAYEKFSSLYASFVEARCFE